MFEMSGEGWGGKESGGPPREGVLLDKSSNGAIRKTPDLVAFSQSATHFLSTRRIRYSSHLSNRPLKRLEIVEQELFIPTRSFLKFNE
jgi:hypothetical protein